MASQALTVLFADLSASTELYQAQGDAVAHQKVSQSLRCMKFAIERHGGNLLRTVGDSALASFEATDAACDAAMDIQREHQRLGLMVKVGFHYGDVIPDAGDVYGHAVNLAARIAGFAEAGEICTSDSAVGRLSRQHRTNTHFLDNVQFKGLPATISVYRVHWRSDSAQTAIIAKARNAPQVVSDSLLALSVNGTQLSVNSSNPAISFGRAADNDVVIESESVSRNHATIKWVKGRYMLNDYSTNGTYLLKRGTSAEFIRRESLSLDQFGVIGLGFDPENSSEHVIEYQLMESG